MISKIYGPLGPAAPFLLKGKFIFQDLCQNNYSWDDTVPTNFIEDWESWKGQLHLLENVVMKRCFKPPGFGKIACCSLHHLSGASHDGYGQIISSTGGRKGKYSLLSCCREIKGCTYTKFVSIPRLELTAAAP